MVEQQNNPDDPPTAADFCLVDEPWIPVVSVDGSTTTVSLLDVFRLAPKLRRIDGEIESQSFALLRLCLAVMHRAFDHYLDQGYDTTATVGDLRQQWAEAGVPDIADYLNAHRDRLFLFHPQAPFFQVAGLRATNGEVSSLNRIVAERPPYLGTRSERGLRRLDPADAARWLVHVHAFDASGIKSGVVGHPRLKGGKVYPEGVGWAGQLGGVYLAGQTLLDSLLLNLWAAPVHDDDRRRRDVPPWERPVATVGAEQDLASRPWGPVDLYTWQARRVRLVGDRDGLSGVVLSNGDRIVIQEHQSITQLEPMTGWRFSKPQTAKYKRDVLMPRAHQVGSRLWQGMAPLVQPVDARGREDGRPPLLIDHAGRLELQGSPLMANNLIRIEAVGMLYGSNNSVLDDVFADSLDLPAALLNPDDPALRQVAIAAVEAAREGAAAVRRLGENLAKASGASRDSLEGPGIRAREDAYSRLDAPYRTWLRDTLTDQDPIPAEICWHDIAASVLDNLAQEMVTHVPPVAWRGFDARGPRDDVGRIFVWFRRALAKAFPKRSNTFTTPITDEKEVS